MYPFRTLFLVVLATTVHVSGVSIDESLASVRKDCDRKLDFKTIEEFSQFISKLRKLDLETSIDKQDSSSLGKCFRDQESLYALENLVSSYDKVRPCKFQEIDKLENYARKYLADKRRPLSLKFFTLFGVNIGYHCVKNLLAHVKQADLEADQLDFIYSMASPTGWNVLINEHTKKSMKFGSSSNAGNDVTNRVARLIPGLVLIDQLDYMSFDHIKNQVSIENWQGIEKGKYEFETQTIASKMHEYLSKIVESCQNLDQFYLNSILSLARLNELGLLVNFEIFSAHQERSLMLHKWLAAASFCQLMARVQIDPRSTDSSVIEFKIYHNNKQVECRRKLYSYVAKFDEINKNAQEKVWLASVPEGKWLQRDEAMFRPSQGGETTSAAMKQLNQFVRGLERDYKAQSAKEAD